MLVHRSRLPTWPRYCLQDPLLGPYRIIQIVMRMAVHTPHTRVRNSGLGLPIGQNDPRQGQN